MNLCVFCGSSSGHNGLYKDASIELAQLIGQNNHTLIYGGGNIGLMGILADAVIKSNGRVIGVIPDFLAKKELAHPDLTKLEVVNSMHERKHRMADLADVFIALPGGLGTLDELAEILTWHQLNLIQKPVGLLNLNSYFNHLIIQMEIMVEEGFLQEETLKTLKVDKSPKDLLTKLGVDLVN